jgi:hypothetical protein
MSTFAQYVAVLMLHFSKKESDEAMAGSFKGLARNISVTVSNNITEKDVAGALEILMSFAGALHFDSPLTGGYWKVNYDNFRYYFIEDHAGYKGNVEEYADIKSHVTNQYPILVTYAETGDAFAKDILEHIQNTPEEDWDGLRYDDLEAVETNIDQAPAANRVVTFDDNQMSQFESATTAVIKAVEAQNHIADTPGIREIILGQLRAGRELILSGCVRIHILQMTLIDALSFLAKRYEKEAIGGLAAALISELFKHLGSQT